MRHPLIPLAVLAAASLAVSVLPAASAAAPTGPVATAAAPARTIRLITGDTVTLTRPRDGTVLPRAGSLVTITAGGQTYAVPAVALPYLGRGLDPSLFDVAAVVNAEAGGRLPVQVRYRARLPALPGVTILAASRGIARGYVTASAAPQFGAALSRQFVADRADGRYGRAGMFGGGLSVSLAGAAATPRPPASGQAMRTLTFTGTNLAGQPDTGDMVLIENVDNSRLLSLAGSSATFRHGIAKFSVPAGHYFAIGFFFGRSSTGTPFPVTHRLDVLPQFTVTGNTAERVAERAASSEITMVTPRPAAVRDTEFDIVRAARTGPAQFFGFSNFRWLGGNSPIWVSPATRRPATGTLATIASQWLAGPPGAAPYEYDLAYQNLSGTIPPQRYLVRRASLAAIEARYYLAATGGYLSRVSSFPIQHGTLAFPYDPVNVPGTRTIYTSAGPDLIWTASLYTASHGNPGTLVQTDAARTYAAGSRVTEIWDAYPLHPVPNVDLIGSRGVRDGDVVLPSASRTGDTLTLDYTPFSDNTPGHAGDGFDTEYGGRKVSGTYQIDENGTKIAGGNAVSGSGLSRDLRVQAALSPARSAISFHLTASLANAPGHLSTRSQTTWTWMSAHQSGGSLPAGWQCGSGGSQCRVEPLLTLAYSVSRMSSDGSAPPGRQMLWLSVGHLPLAQAGPVTGATLRVSFDGGRTWHPARVTSQGEGRFRALFTAPAGASVTLQTQAVDAAGGSITETITSGYRIAAG